MEHISFKRLSLAATPQSPLQGCRMNPLTDQDGPHSFSLIIDHFDTVAGLESTLHNVLPVGFRREFLDNFA